MRRAWGCALLITALVASPSAVAAHGDVRLVDRVLTLAPGESVRFEGGLHYHRLVGRVVADGPLAVRLIGVERGNVAFETGPGRRLVFNELIPCCDDRTWTAHTLVIENVGDAPVTATARVVLVHDDLAVMVYGSESGTRGAILVLGLIWFLALGWAARRPPRAAALGQAALALVVLFCIGGAVLVWGTVRYGGGGVPGFVAGLSHVSVVPWNPMVSRGSLLLAASGLAWGFAGVLWARSGPGAGRPLWLAVGLLLVGAVGVTAVLMTSAYGDALIPAVWALVASVPLLLLMVVRLARRPERIADVDPA